LAGTSAMNPLRNRSFFQLHLSTLLVVTVLAATFVSSNCKPHSLGCDIRDEGYGYPAHALSLIARNDGFEYYFQWRGITLNVLIALISIAIVAAAVELFVRRVDRDKFCLRLTLLFFASYLPVEYLRLSAILNGEYKSSRYGNSFGFPLQYYQDTITGAGNLWHYENLAGNIVIGLSCIYLGIMFLNGNVSEHHPRCPEKQRQPTTNDQQPTMR
jgi:hypothetical protein